jgi:hypothetical protein
MGTSWKTYGKIMRHQWILGGGWGLSDARQDCSLWSPFLHFAWEDFGSVGMVEANKNNSNNNTIMSKAKIVKQ